ncbi:MAG: 30S ribosomal protein S9 [Candidatus Aenigmatarchaeota archaeon]
MAKKKDLMITVGKRKKAIARAIIRSGSGKILINKKPLEFFDRYVKMRISEALLIAGDYAKSVDISVNVKGGGVWGQADATRTAIANALYEWTGDEGLKHAYIDYDRSLLISDARRTEPHKPSRSTAGPRRTKQQSKR